jgi:radical SAM protein with 4Fe4S-binding SPASM domain
MAPALGELQMPGNLLGNAAGLFKGANFRFHRAKEQGMYPTFLIYQVTRKCNSRCAFCSIWKQDSTDELTSEELDKLFADPFFNGLRWVNLTGGEPFIRKDLDDVVTAMHLNLKMLEIVAIPSNGFATKRTVEGARRLLEVLEGKRLLNINISIDGIGEAHERNRGVPGCFPKAMASLEGLLELAKENEMLEVGIEVVITSENVADLKDIYQHLGRYTTHISFTPVIIGPSSFYGKPDKDMGLSRSDIERMAMFFEWLAEELPAYAYYFDKVLDIKMEERGGKRTYPCLGGYTTMYMDSKGEIYPCLIAPNHMRLGSIRERPPSEIWFSEQAGLMRKALKKWSFCEMCTNNCDIVANLKTETIDFVNYLARNPRIFAALMREIRKGKMAKYV